MLQGLGTASSPIVLETLHGGITIVSTGGETATGIAMTTGTVGIATTTETVETTIKVSCVPVCCSICSFLASTPVLCAANLALRCWQGGAPSLFNGRGNTEHVHQFSHYHFLIFHSDLTSVRGLSLSCDSSSCLFCSQHNSLFLTCPLAVVLGFDSQGGGGRRTFGSSFRRDYDDSRSNDDRDDRYNRREERREERRE